MAGSLEDGTAERVAAAMRVSGVPLRLDILRRIATRGALSPSRYVDLVGGDVTLREAAYHFRHLRDAGLISLEELETSGGTAQHFYGVSGLGRAIVRSLPALARAAK